MDFKMKEVSQVYSRKNHHVKRSKNEKKYFDFREILSGWPFVISAPKMMKSYNGFYLDIDYISPLPSMYSMLLT